MTICFLSFLSITSTNAQIFNSIPIGVPGFGPVGIGTVIPAFILDVNGGDINISNAANGYRIGPGVAGSNYVLWHNGNTTNIFVGVGAGLVTANGQNTFVGNNAGVINTTGGQNTFVGFQTGQANIAGSQNAFFGTRAGWSNNNVQNSFMGYEAGYSNTTGNQNTYMGFWSGASSTSTIENSFYGAQSGFNTTTGNRNAFLGEESGFWNTTGTLNVCVGHAAGFFNTGNNNTFVGETSAQNNTTGNNNVALGWQTGNTNTTGGNNTFIGQGADASLPGLNFVSAIGSNAVVTTPNTMILGNNTINVGIGLSGEPTGVLNKLEINAINSPTPNVDDNAPNGCVGTGFSGLKFRDLTSNSLPCPSNNLGLSVDATGNVILVPSATSTGTLTGAINGVSILGTDVVLGNRCGDPGQPGKLTNHREIPMNKNNLIFSGDDFAGGDRIGIGTIPVACMPDAKLQVENNANTGGAITAGLFHTYGNSSSIITNGIDVNNNSNGAIFNFGGLFQASKGMDNFGINSMAILTTPNINCGVSGQAANGLKENIAIQGNATSSVGTNNYGGNFAAMGTNTGTNYGVKSQVSGATQNFGVFSVVNPGLTYGWLGGYPAATNIAVYGNCDPILPPVIQPVNWAGYFDGDVNVNGLCWNTGGGFWIASDQQFKNHIDSIPNALGIIKQLKAKTYYMDTLNQNGLNFSSKKQYGFIAQDVQQILPELVAASHKPNMVDSLGNIITQGLDFIGLNYIEFIPLLTRGIQEQSKIIDSMKNNNAAMQNQINQLAQMINDCCNAPGHRQMQNNNNGGGNNNGGDKSNPTSSTDVKLTDGQSIVLDQNVPNPFAEQTTINYYLPDNTGKAQMLFYNASGKLIQSVELTQKGQGQLNVFAQDLTNGMYTYTLVVDGKIAATKKMVKQ